MSDDRGLAALAEALHLLGIGCRMADPDDMHSGEAAALLGERGVFLPDGRDDDIAYAAGLEDGHNEASITAAEREAETLATIATLRVALDEIANLDWLNIRDAKDMARVALAAAKEATE